ncbi:MAG: hypothetical protein WCO06_06255 [Candidatus Roizmanbacteria bacterium]
MLHCWDRLFLFSCLNSEDVLKIQGDLDQWNKQNSTNFSLEHFKYLVDISICLHDLGKITKSSLITFQDNSPQLDYGLAYDWSPKTYLQRSQDIAIQFIEYTISNTTQNMSVEELGSIRKIITHLIAQTEIVMVNSQERPFWKVMQLLDQIGVYYFSKRSHNKLIAGLLNELYVTGCNPGKSEKIANLVNDRLHFVLPDIQERENILAFFHQETLTNSMDSFLSEQKLNLSRKIASFSHAIIHYEEDIQNYFLNEYQPLYA